VLDEDCVVLDEDCVVLDEDAVEDAGLEAELVEVDEEAAEEVEDDTTIEVVEDTGRVVAVDEVDELEATVVAAVKVIVALADEAASWESPG